MDDPRPMDNQDLPEPGYPLGWCPRHRRPTLPDGSCHLCAGEVKPSRAEYVIVYVIAAVALVGGAMLVGHLWQFLEDSSELPAPETTVSSVGTDDAGPLPGVTETAAALKGDPASEAVSKGDAPGKHPETIAPLDKTRKARRQRATRRRPRQAPPRRTSSAIPREFPSTAHDQVVVHPLSEDQVVVRPVSITMYMTRWCPACTRARRWLRSQKIPYREVNVENDKAGATELRRFNPRGSIPTFNIDGRIMVGFSPAGLTTAIDMARQRRTHGP